LANERYGEVGTTRVDPAVPPTELVLQLSEVDVGAVFPEPTYKVIEVTPRGLRISEPIRPATIAKFILDAVQVAGAIPSPPAAVGEVWATTPD
jgi:hypothetical protein